METIEQKSIISNLVFLEVCENLYSSFRYVCTSGNPSAAYDFDITATTRDGRTVVYSAEVKARNIPIDKYDSLLIEETKLIGVEREAPNTKKYYVSIYPLNRMAVFHDFATTRNYPKTTKKCRRNNVTFDYIEKVVYEPAITDCLKTKY